MSNSTKIRIKKLPPLLINQLSAGEVVTRPASVIKELLENAVDSKATKIIVNITKGGMGLIEVIDNGVGIHPDDMLMAVTRHATSKIANIEHLHGIDTLGFRGEALASISAVSRLTLVSSHDDTGIGRCLTVAGQLDNPDITPIVCDKGTKISVRDLYFNVPARRGNLKTVSTEYAHIETVIRHICLVYTNVELSLFNEGKCRLNLTHRHKSCIQKKNQTSNLFNELTQSKYIENVHAESLLHRLKEGLNSKIPEISHPLFIDLSGLQSSLMSEFDANSQTQETLPNNSVTAKVVGWFWLKQDFTETAQQNKSSDLPKLIYINSRLVKDRVISQKVRAVCHSLTLNHNEVGFALFFSLPTNWLNLNVHPSKERISINALVNITAHLEIAVKNLLKPITLVKDKQKSTNEVPSMVVKTDVSDYKYSTNRPENQLTDHQVSTPNTHYEIKKTNAYTSDSPKNTDKSVSTTKNLSDYCIKMIFNTLELELTAIDVFTKKATTKLTDILSITENCIIITKTETTMSLVANIQNSEKNLRCLIEKIDRLCSPWLVSFNRENQSIVFEFFADTESTKRLIKLFDIETEVTREIDKKRLTGLANQLQTLVQDN